MLDEELKELLRENLETSQESLKILKKINRGRVFGNILWALKWIIIIGLSFGLYLYIEPYIKGLIDTINNLTGGVGGIKNIPGF
jgi:hypothetical protein